MARLFNGTSDRMTVALDLTAFAQLSLSFWMWWDAFAGNDKLMAEFGSTYVQDNGFLIDPNASNNAGAFFNFGMGNTSGSLSWVDQFSRPSAAAWHHYVLTMNRATPVNTAYVDGTAQSLGTVVHNAGTYNNFGNKTLNFMCRNSASLFGAGRLAHLAMWAGTILTAREALALSSGAPPTGIGPVPTSYWPLFGDSPEPDYSGARKSLTLSGTTISNHPKVDRLPARYSYSG